MSIHHHDLDNARITTNNIPLSHHIRSLTAADAWPARAAACLYMHARHGDQVRITVASHETSTRHLALHTTHTSMSVVFPILLLSPSTKGAER